MKRITRTWCSTLAMSSALAFTACFGETDTPPDLTSPQLPIDQPNPPQFPWEVIPQPPARERGVSEFVSADAAAGTTALENSQANKADDDVMLTAAAPEAAREADSRSVEEGDIYRVMGNGLIANLNAYRGLQIIDVSDPQNPSILGRLRISGSPVEMYVTGDRAVLLLNDWRGYYGSRYQPAIAWQEGGLVVLADISDPANPTLLDQGYVQGAISKSRLTTGGGTALYVAAGGYAEWNDEDRYVWETRTYVQSFNVSGESLVEKSALNLGGYVTDIAATTERLMVASYDYSGDSGTNRVAVIDISDPAGEMVELGEVIVNGYVQSQFNMDLYNGVLRVVSAGGWDTQANYLETFDATTLRRLDLDLFGEGESLFATLFLGNKAFFVTYERRDPFHAFAISDEGVAEEKSEFIISGWNEYFRAVAEGTRMLGIGVDDTDGNTMAVSLYDISNLENQTPFITRSAIEVDNSWSEALWDHRAFSVLEDAVSTQTGDGVVETGMVLLPFSGWNSEWSEYTSGVQIFTFSDNTLTRRGVMNHGTQVRRSFLANGVASTANLSDLALSVFDATNPDVPAKLGAVELAPSFTEVFVMGEHLVRVKNSREHYGWWGSQADSLPNAQAEVIARGEDPDTAQALSAVDIPSDAILYQSGNLLVAVTSVYGAEAWETTLSVFDFSDPMHPAARGSITTDRISPYYGPARLGGAKPAIEVIDACFDCGRGWGYPTFDDRNVASVPGALVFLAQAQQEEALGNAETCYTWPNESSACSSGGDGVVMSTEAAPSPSGSAGGRGEDASEPCISYQGGISCQSLNDSDPVCQGELVACTSQPQDESYECTPVDAESIHTHRECYEYEAFRYWQRFTLHVLDLRNPDAPALAAPVESPRDEEGVSILGAGGSVWLSYQRPVSVEGDSRPFVRHYIKELALSDPAAPSVGSAINVPGELLAISGAQLFTRDTVWGETIVETSLARLTLNGGQAFLEAARTFENAVVQQVALDGAGKLLASHQLSWQANAGPSADYATKVAILDGSDLTVLSDGAVDDWAELKHAQPGQALFQVPGGLLILNIEDGAAPYPQAYFPTTGWPRKVLMESADIYFAAGPYGVYGFDAMTFNLLAE